MSERLHKMLAQHGLGSRREIEKWMLAGRVQLNGVRARPGDRYAEGDRVQIDGQDVSSRLRMAAAPRVIAYHKPQGQPVTADAAAPGEPDEPSDSLEVSATSVMERLPALRGSRWLVINTMQPGDSGLLLLTTDGRLADALRRRCATIAAAYVARVLVPAPDFNIDSIARVVRYDEETIEFDSIEPAGGTGTNRWFKVQARRAHRRAAVRALFESNGLKVSRVIQVSFANVELSRNLPRGKHRELTGAQVAELYQLAELSLPANGAVESKPQRTPRGEFSAATHVGRGPEKKRRGSNRPSRPKPPRDETELTAQRQQAEEPARRTTLRAGAAASRGAPHPARARKFTGSRKSGR